ncbi:uracil-DNA glycosylase [Halovivax ruber XH-70]|uniref:Uracil-DNA glycosylase n=1 Tax=Halovivax ruber (strain DSM 18193 / JCM 13892 / XH-70) TaxID=797302 RepID=L0IDT1_HALRX|nr:uracil-DNA glycosylase family protein [Halovivax ruber]AGB17715.1 uracil-DNA glycosylase [Halovivax ruber XH-70]
MSSESPSDPDDPAFPASRHVIEPDCDRCPQLAACREHISWGTGPPDAPVFVVGEAPGAGNPDADPWRGGNWTGMAYTARHSGRRIRRMMDEVGYADESYFTNAVKCMPADETRGAAAESDTDSASESADSVSTCEPTAEELAACRPHLLTELDRVEPDVVVATGKHATTSVLAADDRSLDDLDGSGFLDTVLEPTRCGALDTWLLPILHPSNQDVWISRMGYEADEYATALREALGELCTR